MADVNIDRSGKSFAKTWSGGRDSQKKNDPCVTGEERKAKWYITNTGGTGSNRARETREIQYRAGRRGRGMLTRVKNQKATKPGLIRSQKLIKGFTPEASAGVG